MDEFQIQVITMALDKSFGLRNALTNFKNTDIAIDALAAQTGFRVSFIEDPIEQILTL